VDTETTSHRTAVPRPWSSRPWLAAAGIVLVVACLVPPVSVLARRYLFVESIQFCVFALAAPALIALSATLRRGASEPRGLLPRGAARFAPDPAGDRQRRASSVAMLSYLIAWVVLCVFWRLPSVLDELARHPELVLPEAVTMGVAGLGLWLGLVPAPPSAPRSPRPERALVAALAMWSVWVIAYILGFAHDSVVHAYDLAGSHLSTVDDQEITAFLLWAAAGVAFAPVVFTVLLNWLKDSSGLAGPAGRVPGSGVRGWGHR
jgi:Cytochrome c oxidase caa3 assembly factor (Caa3_CtaG)